MGRQLFLDDIQLVVVHLLRNLLRLEQHFRHRLILPDPGQQHLLLHFRPVSACERVLVLPQGLGE